MYSAYFDESGHPDYGPYLVVAGCVGEDGQWVHFEREWIEALRPLATKIFHAVDFDKRSPPFDKLRERKADDLLDRLVGIICRRTNKTFSHVIPLDHYRAVNKKYLLAESYGYPYPAAARNCMALVSEWARQYPISEEKVFYFFEDGAKHKGQIEWIAERDHQPIPVFRKKSEVIALQAGDLLAWCSNLYLTSNADVKQRYKRALDRLAEMPNDWGISSILEDVDKLPTILKIPLRDPAFRYKCQIVIANGHRRAVVHYWPNENAIEPKVDRKTLVLPEQPVMSRQDTEKAKTEYEEARARLRASVVDDTELS